MTTESIAPEWYENILPRYGLALSIEAARLHRRGRRDFTILAGDAAVSRLLSDWSVPKGERFYAVVLTRDELRGVLLGHPRLAAWTDDLDEIPPENMPGLLVQERHVQLADLPGWTLPYLDSAPLVDASAITDEDAFDLCVFLLASDGGAAVAREEIAAAVQQDKGKLITQMLAAAAEGRRQRAMIEGR